MMWLSLLRGGLKGLAGTSPYAAVNLGQGLGEAAQAYEEGLREQQKTKLAYAKEMADQARAQRQEGLPALTLGAKLKESEDTLQAALARAAKEGDMNTFIRIAVTAARERGDKTPEAILSENAAQTFIKLKAAYDPRAQAAVAQGVSAAAATKQANVGETRVDVDKDAKAAELKRKIEEDQVQREVAARKEVNERLKRPSTALRQRIREIGEGPAYDELLQRELGKTTKPPAGFEAKGSGNLPPGFYVVPKK
jgi:hypothetical protein